MSAGCRRSIMGAAGIRRLGRSSMSASVWSSQASEGGPTYGSPVSFQICCVPPSRGSHFPPTRVPSGGGGSGQSCIRKRVCQGCIFSPCLFNFYAEYVSKMLGWMKHKLESRLPGEISITADMQMIPSLRQKARGTKEPLDKGETGE